MRFQKHLVLFLMPLILFFSFYGCAGPTSAVMPDQLQPLSREKARIVVTREKQLAGMTTPIYIVDIGENIKTNSTMKIRVGTWEKGTGTQTFYLPNRFLSPSESFVTAPVPTTTFVETGRTLDDLISENINAIIYIDYFRCDPALLDIHYCGNGKEECEKPFQEQLTANDGIILDDIGNGRSIEENSGGAGIREVQVIGRFYGGDTLIWDRDPGKMRIGAVWGGKSKIDHTLALIPVNLNVKPGETYYLHYKVQFGERWSILNKGQNKR